MSDLSFIEKVLDGVDVEWMSLGDIGEFIRGNGMQKKDFSDEGFPAIHYGQIFTRYGLSADKTFTYVPELLAKKLKKALKNDLLLATTSENDKDVVKPLAWLGEETAISGDMMLFRHAQNVKYLAYCFQTSAFQTQKQKYISGAKVRRVSKDNLAKMYVPIPCPKDLKTSLKIQAEIVRILDAFSTHTQSLARELTQELIARRNQCNYYREQLLGFDAEEVEWKPLKEITLLTKNIRWKETNNKYLYIDLASVSRENNSIIDASEITTKTAPSRAQKLVEENDVIFATTRPTQMRLCTISKKFSGAVASTGYCVLRAKVDEVLPKWVYHHLSSSRFKTYVEENQSGSAYPAISDSKVKEFKLPIPYSKDLKKSLSEQENIVSILDKLEALSHLMKDALPKEIELRQKQYEYYRDLLLSFPKPREAEV